MQTFALFRNLSMSNYSEKQSDPRRHLFGIVFVVVVHAFLFYAINSGLAHKFVKVIKGPVETKLIEDAKPDLPPPPPPPPAKNLPPPPPPTFVPQADMPQTNAPASSNAIAAVTTAAPQPAPVVVAPPPAPMVRVPAVINASLNCQKPEYPAASRRDEEEGTVQLRFLIDVDGRVIQSQVEKTSGSNRLDEAARAALSRCQFKPGTLDGRPEQSWASMRYTWRLE
jgi:protein TonB